MKAALAPELSRNATNYPRLDYLSGYMTTIYSDHKGPHTRCCDECGVPINTDC